MLETQVPSLDWEAPLEEEVAAHSSIHAWEIPWTEEPGGLQSMELQKSQPQLSDWACMHNNLIKQYIQNTVFLIHINSIFQTLKIAA